MAVAVAGLALLFATESRADTPGEIMALTSKVADWQLAHLDTTHISAGPNDQASQLGWVYGAFYVGLTTLADQSSDAQYTTAVLEHGRRQNWGLEARLFHADDYVIGQSWVWAYEHTGDPAAIAALKARLDAIAAAAPKVPLSYGGNPPPDAESACQVRWCWADALFMGPPAWAELSRATGDPKYLAYADGEFWATVDFLFDKDESLFARDERFFTRRGAAGEKIFWSRGNGWVYAGIVRMLQFLPDDHPSRPRYESLFRKMSQRIVALQKPDGTWPVSLLSSPNGTPPETSGTGFYTFGLAYGVRTGLLPERAYRVAAERGWQALARAVTPEGKLGWVQQIGVGPDSVHAEDTQLYGVGAFLLTGSEMYRLALHDAVTRTVGQSAVTGSAYAAGNVNSVSMARNTLISAGGYQFASFYGAVRDGHVPLLIARRAQSGDGSWQIADTPFSIADEFSNTGARDDHNLVAAAVDRSGYLHLSWGMHNVPLTYAVSRYPVLGRSFGPTLTMTMAKMTGKDENEVTYPEFVHAPDGTLLFTYRNGGAGGGSGNGNQYLNRYEERRRAWRRIASPMVDGISTSMNAYFNSFVFDAKGTLFVSWTIRETPGWTNHDIYVARSADGGQTWQAYDGTPLGRTITRASADAQARIISLPIGTNLMNQTAMTLDAAGRPEIATWWSPGMARGIATRQYMLVWNDGRSWQVSQVSHRSALEENDPVAAKVREMGRPLVLTDREGRTIVVTRSTAAGQGVTDSSNRLTAFWSTDRMHWSHAVLSEENPGVWEPSYDQALWQSQNRLAFFFQPSGLGAAAAPVSVLTWDEAAFFARETPLRIAHATIPAFVNGGYREVASIEVPKSHVIHDKLFPIEGAGIESDRIGYRVYLDGRNAVDVFGKKQPGIVLNSIGQGDASYHDESDWGMDFWHVGDSLGAGSLGVLDNGMARQIGNPARIVATVEAAGPRLARLRIDDTGFTLGIRRLNLSAHYAIRAGSRLMDVSASASRGTPLVAGIAKYANTDVIRSAPRSGWGYFATWGRQSENGKDDVGMALFYPVRLIARTGDDGRSLYALFRNPVNARYAVAAAWAKEGGGIRSEEEFRRYLAKTAWELGRGQPPFDPRRTETRPGH
jgi:unsaturated rhamnogalacturonyl hydrolase